MAVKGWTPTPPPPAETLPSDTYEIQRKLAGVKELRFIQIAVKDKVLHGLTQDGVVYEFSHHAPHDGWVRLRMHESAR